jgi:predicted glycosyltransferase
MAYLAPETFQRQLSVVEKYGLVPFNYILIRKVKLSAHHDVGAEGLNENHVSMVRKAYSSVPIVNSDELKKSEVDPQDMHQVLAHALLVVTDSQTMTAEAACLGVPVIRVNSFVGKLSYLAELEELGLAYGCFPEERQKFEAFLGKLTQKGNCIGLVHRARYLAVQRYGNFNNDMLKAIEESR